MPLSSIPTAMVRPVGHHLGASLTSLADMIAVLSETTAGPFLSSLRNKMRATPSGRSILRERPRITEESVDLARLAEMPEGSLGRAYVSWLKRNKVTPDTRDPVRPPSLLGASPPAHDVRTTGPVH